MAQRQYVEKPLKVLAEQYLASASPPALGVCTCTVNPAFADGRPHVHAKYRQELHETDMIVANKYSGEFVDVMPLAEFEERFGEVTP
jgi:hypothetical protein